MKPLCIVDTCSLVFLHDIQMGNRSLHRWLWGEFNVAYSEWVWNEVEDNLNRMGKDKNAIKRNGKEYIVTFPVISTYERALFGQDHHMKFEAGRCSACNNPIIKLQLYSPPLETLEDRGERHNLCLSLYEVIRTEYKQVIFLTDDYKARRKYVDTVFEDFPIGGIWTSLDFILFLFLRYRDRIPLEVAENAIRDVIARFSGSEIGDHTEEAKRDWVERFSLYTKRARKINRFRGCVS